MKYAVVGAGSIGRAIIADLLSADPGAHVLAIDTAQAALDLAQGLDPGRVTVARVEDNAIAQIAPYLKSVAAVANTTVGDRIVDILQASIQAKVPYVDVHGIFFNERLAYAPQAEAAGVTAVLGMGVSPGLTNMIAADGIRKASGAISVECEYMTHRPLNPTIGLLETAIRQFRDGSMAPVYENGKLLWYPPFSGAMRTRFPRYPDEVELVYTAHSEPETIPHFFPDVQRVTVRGTYHPQMMGLLKSLYQFGLLDPSLEVSTPSGKLPFQPLLRAALMGDGALKPRDIAPLYLMRVRVSGEAGNTRSVSELTLGHELGWDPLPQGRLTALPASFTLQLLAHGSLSRPGVVGPELLTGDQVIQCLGYLQARGLWVEQNQYREDIGHTPVGTKQSAGKSPAG